MARCRRRTNPSPEKPSLRKLRPYQQQALVYGDSRNHLALLVEMRLGKTLVTIRWAVSKWYMKHCFVAAPPTTLLAWEEELSLEGETYYNITSMSRDKRFKVIEEALRQDKRVWILAGYESLLATPAIAQAPWDLAVLDESTKIRNPNAKITELCTKGFRHTKHRVILTGLPSPENDLEIFCQLKFLWGAFAGCSEYYQYRAKYGQYDILNDKWEVHPHAKKPLKDLIHRRCFVLTRQQAGLGRQKIYQKRVVEMVPEQARLYRAAQDTFSLMIENGKKIETSHVVVMENWLMHLAGGFHPELKTLVSYAKMEELRSLLQGELSGEKVVVWFKYRHEVEYAKAYLLGERINCVSVLGGDSMESRRDAVKMLNEAQGTFAFLATEKVAKFGINCSAAKTTIYYSNEWSCEDRAQSEDRILDVSKKEPLLYIDLVTGGTVDVKVAAAVRDKMFNAKQFLRKEIAIWRPSRG